MSSTPYENEPGYETCKSEDDMKMNELYCAKVYTLFENAEALSDCDCRSATRLFESALFRNSKNH